MSNTKKGWFIIVAAFVLITVADYIFRLANGDVAAGGVPVEVFWFVVLISTVFAFCLFYLQSLSQISLIRKTVYLIANAMLAFVLFSAGSYLNVILFGIDSI